MEFVVVLFQKCWIPSHDVSTQLSMRVTECNLVRLSGSVAPRLARARARALKRFRRLGCARLVDLGLFARHLSISLQAHSGEADLQFGVSLSARAQTREWPRLKLIAGRGNADGLGGIGRDLSFHQNYDGGPDTPKPDARVDPKFATKF